jgi:hypothetical protein
MKALKITQSGLKVLVRADKIGGIFPNEIHLLSALRDCKKHLREELSKYEYVNPSLERCIAYHLKKGFIIEVNYP